MRCVRCPRDDIHHRQRQRANICATEANLLSGAHADDDGDSLRDRWRSPKEPACISAERIWRVRLAEDVPRVSEHRMDALRRI